MRYCAILACLLTALSAAPARADGTVVELQIDGAIGAATAEYITNGIEHAEATHAELIIITMDTPGGLMSSMRDIIKAILASDVPVATYVSPAGARADSAGTYILMASHIAAMAPTTQVGAATPVSLFGGDATPKEPPTPGEDEGDGIKDLDKHEPDSTAMERKVLNDSVTYIRGLAERHGRNADWAEDAVVNAATLTAKEALEKNVIEFIAKDRAELLEVLDGYEVEVASGERTLETSNVTIEEYQPNWRIRILSVISNPEIILLLGIVGLYGLLFEGWNPGAVLPGVVGVICLLLAAYALQFLPVNYAGLLLIIVGLGLMTAEAFAPSFGALGLGGITAFVFGAIMMFDTGIPGFGISLTFVIALAVIAAFLIVWVVTYVLKLRRRGAVTGRGSIVGGIGRAMQDFTGDGMVWLEGESWAAHSSVPVRKDQPVVVTEMKGLVLEVGPAGAHAATGAGLPAGNANTQQET
jgi:membrane-bound serine protease (ClpP class)